MTKKIEITAYPESVYPVEKWIYRIERENGQSSDWRPSIKAYPIYSKDKLIEKLNSIFGKDNYVLTCQNGR